MRAVFTTAIRYKVNAVCETPLRTGGAVGNTESVLRDSFGNAFLQGSSLAGALRSWLEKNGEQKTAKALFGSQEHEGHLIVSDAVLRADAEQAIRPRLRIDEKNGTAADKGKFDVAHIVSGSQLDFELTWLGNGQDDEEIMTVERMLGAVNSGEIRLGAQKSNGFGRLTLCVRKRSYDLMNEADRAAWIQDRDDGDEIKLPENVTDRRVTFVLEGIADSVLIRASAPVYEGDQSYTVNIEENGHPILPGSSIKGALRAQCMCIVQSAGVRESLVNDLFGRGAQDGDNGRAGVICVDDVRMNDVKKQRIRRIRINRFTGGVIRGGLFAEEPLSGAVQMTISVKDEQDALCALLVYALRDLGLGLCNLGSDGAIGRGYIAVKRILIQTPDGRKAEIGFDQNHTMSMRDTDGLLDKWQKAWKECMA